MSNKECASQSLTACQKCNPIRMFYEGCCGGDVARSNGMESRNIKMNIDGGTVIYDSCANLEKTYLDEPVEVPDRDNPGKTKMIEKVWACAAYSERPYICRTFECDRTIAEKIKD